MGKNQAVKKWVSAAGTQKLSVATHWKRFRLGGAVMAMRLGDKEMTDLSTMELSENGNLIYRPLLPGFRNIRSARPGDLGHVLILES